MAKPEPDPAAIALFGFLLAILGGIGIALAVSWAP